MLLGFAVKLLGSEEPWAQSSSSSLLRCPFIVFFLVSPLFRPFFSEVNKKAKMHICLPRDLGSNTGHVMICMLRSIYRHRLSEIQGPLRSPFSEFIMLTYFVLKLWYIYIGL